MPVKKFYPCWRKDLLGFRGLTDAARSVFLLVLEWFENFRLRHGLEPGRDATEKFWQTEVVPKDRPREPRQLEQWQNAIKWYLNWVDACAEDGAEQRSLPGRVEAATWSAARRRGLTWSTEQCYGKWTRRYATFASSDREMRRLGTANRFLLSVFNDENCAYSTRKQLLNALTFFFEHVRGLENPVFDVKLEKPD